ncbi:hypothetical protein AYO20_06574 [Fonsecaea nubica]|uniref:Uncharacterized protein n=1 Tax=Fonsecaea nubica TaxID=856822 RepID=A0A178CW97_9EURO|nr:hypothetical protein AYO20_06574 [Fonsecaea nubica]OAL34119.1 hypothetical protein AYO20_06574 [Fonsecaea nubica]
MVHTVDDINSARPNAMMPILPRIEDDPAFLEHQERRFGKDPYSSCHTTGESTLEPLPQFQAEIDPEELIRKPLNDREINIMRNILCKRYHPGRRYEEEVVQETRRIDNEQWRRDENYVLLYHGPDLRGRAGQERSRIMRRHSIKKRWQELGVWNPKWGVAPSKHGWFPDKDRPESRIWEWQRQWRGTQRKFDSLPWEERTGCWPVPDEEFAWERAIRMYLEREGHWSETLKLVSTENGPQYDTDVVDDREFLITSRPWFAWALEAAEEEVKLQRLPMPPTISAYEPARANVMARWKEDGRWKDSWTDNTTDRVHPGVWPHLVGWKWRNESPSPEPADPNDMEFTPSEVDALEAILPPTPPLPPRPLPQEHSRLTGRNVFDPSSGDDSDPQPLEFAEPLHQKTKPRRKASRGPTTSAKVSKLTPPRRSLRIAGRERRLKVPDMPPEAVENLNKESVTQLPPPQSDQKVKETSTKAKTGGNGRSKKEHQPKSSKLQGVAKRRGRSGRSNV